METLVLCVVFVLLVAFGFLASQVVSLRRGSGDARPVADAGVVIPGSRRSPTRITVSFEEEDEMLRRENNAWRSTSGLEREWPPASIYDDLDEIVRRRIVEFIGSDLKAFLQGGMPDWLRAYMPVSPGAGDAPEAPVEEAEAVVVAEGLPEVAPRSESDLEYGMTVKDCLADLEPYEPGLVDRCRKAFGWAVPKRSFADMWAQSRYDALYGEVDGIVAGMEPGEVAQWVLERYREFQADDGRGEEPLDAEAPVFPGGFRPRPEGEGAVRYAAAAAAMLPGEAPAGV